MTQAPDFEFASAIQGLQPDEIANVFIPELPKSVAGKTLGEAGSLLAATAAEVFLRRPESERGLIVGGETIRRSGRPGFDKTIFDTLIREGVPEEAIRSTATGVDPVTNFIRAQELFENNSAVGIVTPAGLWAVHRRIAQRTMTRDHGGLLVRGVAGERNMVHGFDVWASHRVSASQNPRNPDLGRAQKRAQRAKRAARVLHLSSGGYYGSRAPQTA
jgi:hypothetical protein